MNLFKSFVSTGLVACSLWAMPASAAVISADFSSTLDLPDLTGGSGPRTFVAIGRTLGAGPDLSGADETGNPTGWKGFLEVDLTGGGLISLSRDTVEIFGDYDYALITITNIIFDAGETISGITTLASNLMDPNYSFTGGPTISFTDNSISFLWDKTGFGQVSDFRFANDGVATFQIVTTQGPAPVPLPASLPLLMAAIGAIGFLRRRSTV